jgi:hypothetical protein
LLRSEGVLVAGTGDAANKAVVGIALVADWAQVIEWLFAPVAGDGTEDGAFADAGDGSKDGAGVGTVGAGDGAAPEDRRVGN